MVGPKSRRAVVIGHALKGRLSAQSRTIMETEDTTPATDSGDTDTSVTVINCGRCPLLSMHIRLSSRPLPKRPHAVVGKQAGKASGALLEFAQAHALLVTTSVPVATDDGSAPIPVQGRTASHQVGLCLEWEP
jgi:hypothetical protein